jgi:hypothetical protein
LNIFRQKWLAERKENNEKQSRYAHLLNAKLIPGSLFIMWMFASFASAKFAQLGMFGKKKLCLVKYDRFKVKLMFVSLLSELSAVAVHLKFQ